MRLLKLIFPSEPISSRLGLWIFSFKLFFIWILYCVSIEFLIVFMLIVWQCGFEEFGGAE